ncbi:MAG: hypothetical protein HKN43_11715 [Rhodothermales bacterium]|nr:hypothetical protein [Rhodothermales bacterium]
MKNYSKKIVSFGVYGALSVMMIGCAAEKSFTSTLPSTYLSLGVYVTELVDGSYVTVGVEQDTETASEDVLIAFLDESGVVSSTFSVGGSDADNGWAVVERDDDVVIAGFTESYGEGDFDCYLLSTNQSGTINWEKTFGSAQRERCWAVVSTASGLAVVGETQFNASGEDDCYLVLTDTNGIEKRTRSFGGESGDRCFGVAATADGGLLMVGQTYSFGSGDRDMFLIKTDSTGEEEWNRTWGGAASDIAHSISPTHDGGFFVTGYTASFASGVDNPVVLRLDSEGNELWSRVIEMEKPARTITGVQTRGGGYMLTGYSDNDSTLARNTLVITLSETGEVRQINKFLPVSSAASSLGYTVQPTSDGGGIITGHFTTQAGRNQLYVTKLARGSE